MIRSKMLINIWGVKFNLLSTSELVETINSEIKHGNSPVHITGVNPETVVHAYRNETIREAISTSDFVNIDNALIVIMLRLSGYAVPERVATPDLFEALLQVAHAENFRVFILGAEDSALNTAIQNIRNEYPRLQIAGHNGYYNRECEHEIIAEINDFSPEMLFIALPSPEKESFILRNKRLINSKLFLGIGGAIDCKAGVVKRPPRFLRNNGLEGILRTMQNPLNYGKRYVQFYPLFLAIVVKELFKKNQK